MTLNEQHPSDNVNLEPEAPPMEVSSFEPEKKGLVGGALPIWAIGAMVLLLVVLAVVLMFRGASDTDTEWRQKVEAKLRFMEDRLVKLEAVSEGPAMAMDNGPVQAVEHLDQRLNAMEQNVSTRLSTLENRLEAVTNKITGARASTRQSRPAASGGQKPADDTGHGFHVVKSGETFYSISKMYGMSVDDLLKKNNLEKTDIIKPGQKLAVNKAP